MQIAPVDSIYSAYEPYDVSLDNLTTNQNSNIDASFSIDKANGLEAPATFVAINPIPQESIELRDLQNNIISSFDELKSGEISKDEFSNILNELGVLNNQSNSSINIENEKNNQDIQNLASAFIETVKNASSSENKEVALSQYASLFDKINEQTQSPKVNEQLQAYTQNLRY